GPFNATKRAQTFMTALNVTSPNDLMKLSAEQLKAGLKAVDPVIGSGGVYFGPVLDERSLTRHPFYPDAPAQSANIPMIIGNTHDETRAFLGGDPTNFTLTWEQLPEKLIPNLRVDIQPEMVIATYRKLYPQLSP